MIGPRSDEMRETGGVALIYVRRCMVRYEQDRAGPEPQVSRPEAVVNRQ